MIRVYPIAWKAKEITPLGDTIFPGGECHWQVQPAKVYRQDVVIDARVNSNDEFMKLLVVTDALRACGPRSLSLFIPYFPGARQDRRELGGPLTAKIYADLINRLGFDNVIILDPHSDVLPALLDNVVVIPSSRIFEMHFDVIFDRLKRVDYVIAPDRGAEKRARSVANFFRAPVITAGKSRDPITGKLSGFYVDALPGAGNYLVVDDICDGGGTFAGLAEAFLRDDYATDSTLSLYVTHGIFSQGLWGLNKLYHQIISTDSFIEPLSSATDSWNERKNLRISLDYFWNEASISLTKF